MLSSLAKRWRAASEARAVARRPIADDLWQRTLNRYSFLKSARGDDAAELKRLASLFLDRKEFTAMDGMRLSNDVVVAIAAQACLPVLRLGLQRYDGFVGIVLHRDAVVARREVPDDDGVVHVYDEVLSGEAVQGGPLMLSWRDVRGAGHSAASGYNVVIHEFAHVLDMEDGASDGVPILPSATATAQWRQTLECELQLLRQRVESDVETAIDPYAAKGAEEFFAVCSEAFFVAPALLKAQHAAFYERLREFYRQDPLVRA